MSEGKETRSLILSHEEENKFPVPPFIYVDTQEAIVVAGSKPIPFPKDSVTWDIMQSLTAGPVTAELIRASQKAHDTFSQPISEEIRRVRSLLDPEHDWRYQLVEEKKDESGRSFHLLTDAREVQPISTEETVTLAKWLMNRITTSQRPEEDAEIRRKCQEILTAEEYQGIAVSNVKAVRRRVTDTIQAIRLLPPERQAQLIPEVVSPLITRAEGGPEQLFNEGDFAFRTNTEKNPETTTTSNTKKRKQRTEAEIAQAKDEKERREARAMKRPDWLKTSTVENDPRKGIMPTDLRAGKDTIVISDAERETFTPIVRSVIRAFLPKHIPMSTRDIIPFPEEVPLQTLVSAAPQLRELVVLAGENGYISLRTVDKSDGKPQRFISLNDIALLRHFYKDTLSESKLLFRDGNNRRIARRSIQALMDEERRKRGMVK